MKQLFELQLYQQIILFGLALTLFSVAKSLIWYFIGFLAMFVGLVALVLIGLIVNARITYSHIAALPLVERQNLFKNQITFVTIYPTVASPTNQLTTWRQIIPELQTHLRDHPKDPLSTWIDGYTVDIGLTPNVPNAESIILNIGGSWAGLFPDVPKLNAFVNSSSQSALLALRIARYIRPNMPIIGFDFPTTTMATLNCGQNDDSFIIQEVYNSVTKTYPDSKIILMADCLGGLRLLNWLAMHDQSSDTLLRQVSGIVLESPIAYLRSFVNNLTASDTMNDYLYKGLCMTLPNWSQELDQHYSFRSAKHSIPNIRTLIGFLPNDKVSPVSHLSMFTKLLPNSNVVVSSNTKATHGQLIKQTDFQEAVLNFMQQVL